MGTWLSGNAEPRYNARCCLESVPRITLPALRQVVGSIERLPTNAHEVGQVTMAGVVVMYWTILGRRLNIIHNGPSRRAIPTTIYLSWTEAGFGGRRWWMECPLCGDNRTGVYLRWGRLACRECQELAYRSTRQSQRARQLDQVRKRRYRVKARLVDGWDKPSRMGWTTYDGSAQTLVDVRV